MNVLHELVQYTLVHVIYICKRPRGLGGWYDGAGGRCFVVFDGTVWWFVDLSDNFDVRNW